MSQDDEVAVEVFNPEVGKQYLGTTPPAEKQISQNEGGGRQKFLPTHTDSKYLTLHRKQSAEKSLPGDSSQDGGDLLLCCQKHLNNSTLEHRLTGVLRSERVRGAAGRWLL